MTELGGEEINCRFKNHVDVVGKNEVSFGTYLIGKPISLGIIWMLCTLRKNFLIIFLIQ